MRRYRKGFLERRTGGGVRQLLGVALAAAVVALSASPLAAGVAPAIRSLSPTLFPVPKGLEANLAFWIEIFAKHDSNHVVVHDEMYPGVVYVVLDFSRIERSMLSESAKRRRRREEVERVERRYRALLLHLAAGRDAEDREQARLRTVFGGVPGGAEKYRAAAGRFREQTGLADRFQEAIERSGRYMREMERILLDRNLPVDLARIPFVESMFQEQVRSRAGAGGIWQLMPSTARGLLRSDMELDERYDPFRATEAAALELERNYRALGNWPLAITAYNSGRNGMLRAVARLGTDDPGEVLRLHVSRSFGFASRNFYTEFLAAATIYDNREVFFPGLVPDPALAYDEFVPDRYVPIRDLAAASELELAELQDLNPAISNEVWRGDLWWPKGYRLRVPSGAGSAVEAVYAALPESRKSPHQTGYRYRVRPGDTLGVLARRFGTTVGAVQRANRLRHADFIRVGQVLVIPPTGGRRLGSSGAGGVHVVQPGDTLSAIARLYGSCVSAIQTANRLGNSSRIVVGQRLTVPPCQRGDRTL